MKVITNGKIILPDSKGIFFIDNKIVAFDEKIISVESPEHTEILNAADEIIDAENNFVAPGFINIHIHGCNGFDAMDEDISALDGMSKFLPSCGVTSFLPTTMTMSVDRIKHALKNIRAKTFHEGKNLTGSKPIVSIILNGISSFSYDFVSLVVPLTPIPVAASIPKIELISVVFPTPEFPRNNTFPFFIAIPPK